MSQQYVTSVINKALLKEVAKLCTAAANSGEWNHDLIPKVKALLKEVEEDDQSTEEDDQSLENFFSPEIMKKIIVMGIIFFNRKEEITNVQTILQILAYTPSEVKQEEQDLFEKITLGLKEVFTDFHLYEPLFISSLTLLSVNIAIHPGMLSLVEEAKTYLGQNSAQETAGGFIPGLFSQLEQMFSEDICSISLPDVEKVD